MQYRGGFVEVTPAPERDRRGDASQIQKFFLKGTAEGFSPKLADTSAIFAEARVPAKVQAMQIKVFTIWMNIQLEKAHQPKVMNFNDDWGTCVPILRLLEALSGKSVGKFHKPGAVAVLSRNSAHVQSLLASQFTNASSNFGGLEPKNVENAKFLLDFLNVEGIASKAHNINYPEQINTADLQFQLKLLWVIIYHYQVSPSFKVKDGMSLPRQVYLYLRQLCLK